MLAVAAVEYAEIVAAYADLDLPEQSAVSIIEIESSEISAANLQAAINQALEAESDALIVVRTSENAHEIAYESAEDALSITVEGDDANRLTIVSYGDQPLTINASNLTRALTAASSGSVALGGIVLCNGTAPDGGGLYSTGTGSLALSGCSLTGNTASGAMQSRGGGLCFLNGESLTLTNCTVDSNLATGMLSGNGGGVYSSGATNLSNCSVTSNSTTGASMSSGAGLYILGDATLSGCDISENYSTASVYVFGVGIYSSGSITIADSAFGSNSASGAYYTYGGVLYSTGEFEIVGSTMTNNALTGNYCYGGALWSKGSGVVSNSEGSNNSVAGSQTGFGGWLYSYEGTYEFSGLTLSGNAASGPQARGGAICEGVVSGGSSITMTNSSSSGNTVSDASSALGGALYLASGWTLNATNSFFVENTAEGNDDASGGGATVLGAASFVNCTVAGNVASGDSSTGGGVAVSDNGSASFYNTIIARNEASADADVLGASQSEGHNALSSASDWGNSNESDVENYVYDSAATLFVGTDGDSFALSNYSLADDSQALDLGNSSYFAEGLFYDLNGVLDLGAYLSPATKAVLSAHSFVVQEGCATQIIETAALGDSEICCWNFSDDAEDSPEAYVEGNLEEWLSTLEDRLESGSYTLRSRIKNTETGQYGYVSECTLTVTQTLPALNVETASYSDGQLLTLALTAESAYGDPIAQWIIDWGDGETTTVEELGFSLFTGHVYAQGNEDAEYEIAVQIVDSQGRGADSWNYVATQEVAGSTETSDVRLDVFAVPTDEHEEEKSALLFVEQALEDVAEPEIPRQVVEELLPTSEEDAFEQEFWAGFVTMDADNEESSLFCELFLEGFDAE